MERGKDRPDLLMQEFRAKKQTGDELSLLCGLARNGRTQRLKKTNQIQIFIRILFFFPAGDFTSQRQLVRSRNIDWFWLPRLWISGRAVLPGNKQVH